VKFRCERDVLADALATAGRAATSRTGSLPVLEGLHLAVRGDELAVTGTDLEMSIRLNTTVGGVVDGAVVVPARLSADAVKSLPAGAVEFSSGGADGNDDTVIISAGRSRFSLRRTAACSRRCGRQACSRHASSNWPVANSASARLKCDCASSPREAMARRYSSMACAWRPRLWWSAPML
jgi:DNA polymerase-3 subunit beta